jgi:hypothetical protein
METCLESKEPISVESESKHQESPKEEATVETFKALKERYGDRHLAVGHHRKLKKRIQGDGGSQKKLTTTRKQMTRLAIPDGIRDTDDRDKARTKLYQEPRKDGCLGRDIRQNRKASVE